MGDEKLVLKHTPSGRNYKNDHSVILKYIMMYVYAFKNEIHYFVDIYTNFFLGPSLPQMIKQPNPKKHKKHDLVKWYDLWLNQ